MAKYSQEDIKNLSNDLDKYRKKTDDTVNDFYKNSPSSGWFTLLVIIFISFIIIFAFSFMVDLIYHLLGRNFEQDTIMNIISQCVFYISTVVMVLLTINFKNLNFKETFSLNKTKFYYYIISIIFPIFLILITAGIYYLIGNVSSLKEFALLGEKPSQLVSNMNATNFVILVIFSGILPIIFDEFLFRGFLFDAFNKGYSTLLTIILTALLFSIMGTRLQYLYLLNISNIINLFIFGLFLGFITYKSKSIYPAIISHLIYNFFYLMFLANYLN